MKLPIVVSAEQANEATTDGLKFVDLRPLEDYAISHLPGAIHLDVALLNRSEKPVGGLLPAFEQINHTMSNLGLGPEDHVIAYDQGAASAAARLIWVLHAYGFNAISWLNGGFGAWTAAGLATSAAITTPTANDAQLQFTPGNVVSVDQFMNEIHNDNVRILDVRSAAEFDGSDVRSARGGHIPNAIHSEWTNVFDGTGQLKSDDELHELFAALGIDRNHHVVVYCQTHQRSALTYVVLKHLQYQLVCAIDGAWSAWGNRTDTPIET